MKANVNNRKTVGIFVVLALLLCAFSSVYAYTAHAASNSYYICYESDGYRVRASNALKETQDGVFTISPYLTRGDKFYISDGAGRLWGDASGQCVTVTESGRQRYAVSFCPDQPYDDGSYVSLQFYAPAAFDVLVNDSYVCGMTYLRANAVFEEYYAYLDLQAGDRVKVRGDAGVYGQTGLDSDGVSVGLQGRYRFSFTADEDFLYGDAEYISFSDYPQLYLLCKENGFEKQETYRLERDESVIAYSQYKADISLPKKDGELEYRILDESTQETYLPSQSGKITVHDKGDYDVLFSPDHVYSAVGGNVYHTALQRKTSFYDGYYVLGDFNDYTFIDDSGFDDDYKLILDTAQTAYDEYKLTLYITQQMLKEFDGRAEFYISDGQTVYRKPNGGDIGIESAGEYELTFSPTHDYGRGYRYRYVKTAQESEEETIVINDANQFAQFLSNCTSPEYSLNKKFTLSNDVDLTGIDYSAALIFAGEFDGMYRSVTGIVLSGEDCALFKNLTADAVVRRVNFSAAISSDRDKTALVGENNGTIDEVSLSGSVQGRQYTGGIAALNTSSGKITKCVNRAAVDGVMNAGGIVGFNAGSVEGCENHGNVNFKTFATSDARTMLNTGGIAGYSTGNISGCENHGDIGYKQGRYVGGIVGLCSGGIHGCVNYGDVAGDTYTGGIVGYYGRFSSGGSDLSDYLSGSEFEQWLNDYFGSDSGNFEQSEDSGIHEIFYAINYGDVFAENYAGGIAGYGGAVSLKIVGCANTGNVNAHTSYAGGVAAQAGEGVISGCLTYGDVSAAVNYAGGIVGLSTATIENCQTSAYVSGNSFVGGIAASASTVRGCISNAFIEKAANGTNAGMIAGEGTLSGFEYNYYLNCAAGGIDGISYGYSFNFAAFGLDGDELMCEGMLSEKLIGISSDSFLAGEKEKRYPIPRVLLEKEVPETSGDSAAFTAAFDGVAERLRTLADTGSLTFVTVTFYSYNFDRDVYERMCLIRLHKGGAIDPSRVPEVVQQEGYFVWWDTDDFSVFNENASVYQKYDKALTTLASDGSDKPLILAEGKFYSDTVISTVYNGGYISLVFMRGDKPYSYGDVTVKYYVGDTDACRVKLLKGNEQKEAQLSVSGDYICFTLSEGWAFTVEKESADLFALWIVLSALCGAAAVAVGVITAGLIIKRKNKSKN